MKRISETSLIAWDSVKDHLQPIEALIVGVFNNQPGVKFTRQQIADQLARPFHTTAARITKLIDVGVLVEDGRVYNRKTNRPNYLLKLNSEQFDFLTRSPSHEPAHPGA